ncbi:hypothetical protein V8F06_010824 [Rhypophila decipiens]
MDDGSDNYWPTLCDKIKRWSEGRHQGVTKASLGIESITCSICQEGRLAIAGFQSHLPPSLSPGPQELGVVLACGHIVGKECVTNWRKHCVQKKLKKQTYSCPFCRLNLGPVHCSRHQFAHIISLTQGQQDFGILSQNVQKGLDEARAHLEAASSCPDCISGNAGEKLAPRPYQLTNLTQADWDEIEAVLSQLFGTNYQAPWTDGRAEQA